MELKDCLRNFFSKKELNKRQLKTLLDCQKKYQHLEKESKLNWSFAAISIFLGVSLFGQWYLFNNYKNMANKKQEDLVNNLVMSVSKSIPAERKVESFEDLTKKFDKLDFVPIPLKEAALPYKNYRLVGANYLFLGDSMGVYVVFKDPNSDKQVVMIQKPITSEDLEAANSDLEAVKNGVNVKMWNDSGVLTAVAW